MLANIPLRKYITSGKVPDRHGTLHLASTSRRNQPINVIRQFEMWPPHQFIWSGIYFLNTKWLWLVYSKRQQTTFIEEFYWRRTSAKVRCILFHKCDTTTYLKGSKQDDIVPVLVFYVPTIRKTWNCEILQNQRSRCIWLGVRYACSCSRKQNSGPGLFHDFISVCVISRRHFLQDLATALTHVVTIPIA